MGKKSAKVKKNRLQKSYLNNNGKHLDEVPEYGTKKPASRMMKTPNNSKRKMANGKMQTQVKSEVPNTMYTVAETQDHLRLHSMDNPTNLNLSGTSAN